MGLKRDSKGNLTEVTPLRSRKGSIYKKGANETFKQKLSYSIKILEYLLKKNFLPNKED